MIAIDFGAIVVVVCAEFASVLAMFNHVTAHKKPSAEFPLPNKRTRNIHVVFVGLIDHEAIDGRTTPNYSELVLGPLSAFLVQLGSLRPLDGMSVGEATG